jgi:magnesium-transporting ATPase (P-type)
MRNVQAEEGIMLRLPRHADTDRLVTARLAAYFSLQAGLILTGMALLGYFLVFIDAGIPAKYLPFSGDYFQSNSPSWTIDGKVFTNAMQLDILAQAQTMYWVMLTTGQLGHIWMCKCRNASIFTHGLFGNMVMNYGAIIELTLIMFVVFVPFSQPFFGTKQFLPILWILPLAPFVLIFSRNELVRYMARNYPDSWVAQNLNW